MLNCLLFRNVAAKFIKNADAFTKHNLFSTSSVNSLSFRKKKSSVSSKLTPTYKIELAKTSDFDKIMDLLRSTYYREEPVMVAAGLSGKRNPVLEELDFMLLCEGMTLIAKSENETILGVCMNRKSCPWDANELDRLASAVSCKDTKRLMHFYAFLRRAPNLFSKYCVSCVFDIDMLATHNSARKMGIGSKLLAASRELGTDMGFSLLRVDAVNYYTGLMCEKQKMFPEMEIGYCQYLNEDKQPVFAPKHPHTLARVFIERPGITESVPPKKILNNEL